MKNPSEREWRASGVTGRLALSLAIVVQGCATALAPPAEALPPPVCAAPAGQDCLNRGIAAFDAYRRGKLQLIEERSAAYRLPSAPVAFINSERSEYSVLLVHGLNDSAYYLADLGELLNRQGFNVVSVLLPGHGTDTHDMLDTSAEAWRDEVDRGLTMAALVGEKVIVGGFSLGSALAIDALLRGAEIHGLLLFSPAIRLRSFAAIASWSCAPGLRSYLLETSLPENPVKYKLRTGNSLCQLSRLMASNLAAASPPGEAARTTSEELQDLAQRVKVPTFVAFSYADQRISPPAALEFAAHVAAPVRVVSFGKPAETLPAASVERLKIITVSDAELPHSYLVRRSNPYNGQANPCFDRLASLLAEFLAEHFHARPAAGAYPACGPLGEFGDAAD